VRQISFERLDLKLDGLQIYFGQRRLVKPSEIPSSPLQLSDSSSLNF
jgi:hypothetical protein